MATSTLAKPERADRMVDVVVMSLIALLFCTGYSEAGHGWLSNRLLVQLNVPLLVFGAFFAIFYPFRFYTRILWFVMVPLLVLGAPTLGFNACMALYRDVGLESKLRIDDLMLWLLLFVLSTLVWTIPYLVGWRLRLGAGRQQRRSVGLSELFALTGVVCFLLTLFRDSFSLAELGLLRRNSLRVVWAESALGFLLFGPLLWIGFYVQWKWLTLVLAAPLLLLPAIAGASFQERLRDIVVDGWGQMLPPVLLSLATIGALRYVGFRIVWHDVAAEDVDVADVASVQTN